MQIEKNIPIPAMRSGKKSEATLLMEKMEVGDSFTFDVKQYQSVLKSAQYIGIKIQTRPQIDKSGKKVTNRRRLWRVA